MARTRHYGHGRGGKVVVVTRKLSGVGAEPTIVSPFHIPVPVPGSAPRIQSGNETCSSVLCSAPCLVQFLTVLGRTKIMQVVGQGREEGAVSGVKGSRHTQSSQGQSGEQSCRSLCLLLC